MKELWVEKYRPKTVDGYVFRDEDQRKQVETWIRDKSIPHLLFSGNAGIGKTTLAKMLFNEINVNPLDLLEINASRDNGVDFIRFKIESFVQMIPFGDFKIVLLDEADYLSPSAQATLRGIMEQYADHSRFVLTCNFPNRIIPAIHSRCQSFHIAQLPQDTFMARVGEILVKEGVQFDENTLSILDTYVKVTYPDLRKCINMVQQNVNDGILLPPNKSDTGSADWKVDMVELFKSNKIQEARKLLCGTVRAEEMEEIYRWLYDNLELFGDEEKQDQAVLIIKQGLVDHALVVDPEINLAATLIKLSRL